MEGNQYKGYGFLINEFCNDAEKKNKDDKPDSWKDNRSKTLNSIRKFFKGVRWYNQKKSQDAKAIRQVRLGSWKKKKHFKDTIERRKIVQEKIGTFQHLDADESMVGEKCLNDLEVGTKMTRLGCHIDQ